MSGTRFLTMLFALLLISCTPPEEPSDTDETTDSDTPVTDIDPNDQINFPDPVLRTCIEELTGKSSGEPIYAKDVADIEEVYCDDVSDLMGMEFFSRIKTITFYNNNINSLKSLSGLYSLKYM
ncbi:MAG TPA: hypothetical protein PKH10_01435, partial [bacterium]|nr:hypothetical protein [bacterium]